ncbi:MAG: DUF2252 domain-containing protein, partial [Gemmataceae bacterium]|nr:DUF2252 domain-containing protein [Gemmataceae bacterium]
MPANPASAANSPPRRAYRSFDELYAQGKALRESSPRQDHAMWSPPADRLEPITHLERSSEGRIPELIPIRHGRMLKSPFTFYRGAAQNMAADLAGTPVSGLRVQACGDCHLLNFGAYATPERRLVFDINDLDETLPAPWEWDVKRLAVSFVLACRDNGFDEDDARDAARACVGSYRERMGEYARMSALDVWYASISVDDLLENVRDEQARKRGRKRVAQARERSVLEHEFPEMVVHTTMGPVIREQLPLIFHQQEQTREEFEAAIRVAFAGYRETLPEHRRVLLDRYQLMDIAVKVVGVGSVGTVCSV